MGRVRLNTLLEDAKSTLDSAPDAKGTESPVAATELRPAASSAGYPRSAVSSTFDCASCTARDRTR